MSYWVILQKPGEKDPCKVPVHSEGGTRVAGGTQYAELNVTYNYGGHIRKALHPDGLKWLNGKVAKDVIQQLENAVATLGTRMDDDYWKDTEGNAGFALSILLGWAKLHPEAVFEVD